MTTTTKRPFRRRAGLVAGLLLAPIAIATPASATPGSVDATAAPALNLAVAVPAGTDLWVEVTKLSFREGPSAHKGVVAYGYRKAKVDATGKVKDSWTQVKVGGAIAWARTKHLTTSKPAWDPVRVGTKPTLLSLRSRPSTDAPVTATAPRGSDAIFTRIERQGWWQVKLGDRYAWAPMRFFDVGGLFDVSRILKVAHSQVGYREPAWRDNKYNDWINGDNAWCSVFVSWVFAKSDYAAGVPRRNHFDSYVADLRAAGVLDTSPTASEIRKGDVVLVDWYPYNGPTHTGIVDHVSGSSIYLVEGNTTSGSGDQTRGVFYRQRAMVDIYAVYRPSEYAYAKKLG